MERWERPLSPQPMYRAPEVELLPLSLYSGHVLFFFSFTSLLLFGSLLFLIFHLSDLSLLLHSSGCGHISLAVFSSFSFAICFSHFLFYTFHFQASFVHTQHLFLRKSDPSPPPLTPPPPLPALFSMIPVSLHDWYRPYHPQHLETFLLNIIHMVIHVLKKRTVCVCWLLVCICSTCYMYSTELQQWKLDWENEESIMKHQLEVLCLNKCPHWLKSRSDRPCTSASAQYLLLIRLIWPLCLTAIMTEYLQLFLTHKAVLFISRNIPYDSINEGTRVELLHLDLLWVHQT